MPSLSTMHIMEGECEKSGGCLTAEGAPELSATKANGVVALAEEALENGSSVHSPENKAISEEPPGQDEPGGSEDPDEEPGEEPGGGDEQMEDETILLQEEQEQDMTEMAAASEEPESEPINMSDINPIPRLDSPEQTVPSKEEAPMPSPAPSHVVEDVRESPAQSPVKENGLLSPPVLPSPKPTPPPPKEEKEDSEEEDKPSIVEKHPSTDVQLEKIRKRSLDGEASSSSESDSTKKRLRHQEPTVSRPHPADPLIHGEDERESSIQRFIEGCAQSIEEISLASEKLQKEMSALAELAKAKEIEWNSILRLRKLKEEMYERLQRKKREVQVLEGKFSDDFYHHHHHQNPYANQGAMASAVSMLSNPMLARIPDLNKQQRPILPKPFHHVVDHGSSLREGRNGPILDVKGIIADYRSRHGGEAPPGRRGRRRTMVPTVDHHIGPPPPRHISSSPSLISMANMALGTAFNVRTYDPPPPPYPPPPMNQERIGGEHGSNASGMSFKEALVQFAKLGPGGGRGGTHLPYPEVTLHPVGSAGIGQPLHPPPPNVGHHPGSQPMPSAPNHHLHPPSSQALHPGGQSLLHGILTKGPIPAHTKPPPTTFSPTLARLLTAPDLPKPQPAHQNSYHRPSPVSINEILASKKMAMHRNQSSDLQIKQVLTKSRTDITITPVSSSNTPSKPKEEVVLLQDEDEEGSTGDRLVIDEGPDGNNQEDVPQCQGCRQKPAQFVCAGCGNQWYCSRECQVSAWEDHSDVCSG